MKITMNPIAIIQLIVIGLLYLITIRPVLSQTSADIVFKAEALYPEGVAFNAEDRVFYVSSMRHGTIGKVSFDGQFEPFISDTSLVSTVGLFYAPSQSTLYACVSDVGISTRSEVEQKNKRALVIAFDIPSGKRKFVSDLTSLDPDGNHFANDMCMDPSGNLYVTNSFQPFITKVSPDGRIAAFASTPDWDRDGFNLNGIALIANDYLLTAQTNTGMLYRVDLNRPESIHTIEAIPIDGADGIVGISDSLIAVISNKLDKVVLLKSQDGWLSAQVAMEIPSAMRFPTTGVMVNGKVYVVNSKLNELFEGDPNMSNSFIIQSVDPGY